MPVSKAGFQRVILLFFCLNALRPRGLRAGCVATPESPEC
jgi:hypothetical protein